MTSSIRSGENVMVKISLTRNMIIEIKTKVKSLQVYALRMLCYKVNFC